MDLLVLADFDLAHQSGKTIDFFGVGFWIRLDHCPGQIEHMLGRIASVHGNDIGGRIPAPDLASHPATPFGFERKGLRRLEVPDKNG